MTDAEKKDYRVVYQGGLHDVWCNGQAHIWCDGGTANIFRDDDKFVIRTGTCDCHKFRQSA